MIHTTDLEKGYSLFGNKGNVWNNTAHIYKNGEGNLCGTPAHSGMDLIDFYLLSTNHVRIEGIKVAGCEECLKNYVKQQTQK